MSERERGSEVIEIDNDITTPGPSKWTNRTVTDKLIKKPSQIFEPVLQTFRVNDGMKGETPDILYDLCLVLDKLYSEPIDGLPEPTRRKLHALFMTRWNVFHTPVYSAYFNMDKAFCHIWSCFCVLTRGNQCEKV
jgi:hypothetical protein